MSRIDQYCVTTDLSYRVSTARVAKGWTVKNLAERSGVGASYIAKLEDVKNPWLPSIASLIKLANALNISLTALFEDY